jgi:hypothetical protein
MQEYSTNLGLTVLPELEQKKDPAVYGEIFRLRSALRILQGALDSYTGALSTELQYQPVTSPASSIKVQNISRVYVEATEAIAYGEIANLWNSAGLKVRKASAGLGVGFNCRAYCNTTGGVAIGDFGEFILLGNLPSSGVTPGAEYFMSTTAGLITSTAPAAVGNIYQRIGFGLDSNNIWFNPSLEWRVI